MRPEQEYINGAIDEYYSDTVILELRFAKYPFFSENNWELWLNGKFAYSYLLYCNFKEKAEQIIKEHSLELIKETI